jgi:AICAR transformylase/IMP cyclohydrolase PurH
VKHVKSNAITIAKDSRLLGMGSGQPNRVNSVPIAIEKSAKEVQVSLWAAGCMHGSWPKSGSWPLDRLPIYHASVCPNAAGSLP